MQPIRVIVRDTATEAVRDLADEIEQLVRAGREGGRPVVLGLATGATPLPLYAELIRRHREGGLSFRDVTTFNLDEYLGLSADHPCSYRRFMREQLFSHLDLDLDPARTHIPDGSVPEEQWQSHCDAYETTIREAGGIDLQILGIGRTGHIGFNEPGSPRSSRTRVVELDERTREDAAAAFGGINHVPRRAITMGCGTILDARRLRLMAWGAGKAEIVGRAVRGPVTAEVSASFLQEHPDACVLLDRAAGAALG